MCNTYGSVKDQVGNMCSGITRSLLVKHIQSDITDKINIKL